MFAERWSHKEILKHISNVWLFLCTYLNFESYSCYVGIRKVTIVVLRTFEGTQWFLLRKKQLNYSSFGDHVNLSTADNCIVVWANEVSLE